jgi:hypothetical protein
MGARGRTRHHAKAAQPNAARFTNTTPDRRASVRYPQSVDGSDALPDQDIAEGEYRDEFACTCLQHETSDADPRNGSARSGNQGLKTHLSLAHTPESAITGIRVAAIAHPARPEQRSHTASTRSRQSALTALGQVARLLAGQRLFFGRRHIG